MEWRWSRGCKMWTGRNSDSYCICEYISASISQTGCFLYLSRIVQLCSAASLDISKMSSRFQLDGMGVSSTCLIMFKNPGGQKQLVVGVIGGSWELSEFIIHWVR